MKSKLLNMPISNKIQYLELFPPIESPSSQIEDIYQLMNETFENIRHIITNDIRSLMSKNMVEARIEARRKMKGSVDEKLARKNLTCVQIYDYIGLRIIVETITACYEAMSLIASRYHSPIERIKDYIKLPRKNGYRGLHMVIYFDEFPIEIQIRTEKMHLIAECGKASRISKIDPYRICRKKLRQQLIR